MKYSTLLVLLLVFIGLKSRAQQYNFLNYSVEEGLAQSQVSDIVQDNGGYLWVATRGGLSRYDGKHFLNYSKNQGLISNQLSDLYIDSKNRLWVGAEGGISIYKNNQFFSFQFKEEYSKYQVNEVLAFNDTLYIGTNGGGVILFYDEQFFYPNEDDQQINVRSMAVLDGKIIIGTRYGLFQVDSRNTPSRMPFLNHLDSVSIGEVYTNDNKLYISSLNGDGVFVYNQGKIVKNYTTKQGLLSDRARAITVDDKGIIWIVTKVGIVKIKDDVITNFTTTNGLPHNNVNCVQQDSDGNIWFGTDGKGICLFTGEAFVNYTQKDGLSSDFVMSIVQDSSNNLWFSTYGGGLTEWNNGKPVVYTMNEGLPNNTIWASLKDSKGCLWFGTSSGVVKYVNGQFIKQQISENQKSNKVTYLFEDSQKRVWMGGQYGVWVNDADSLQFLEIKDELRGNNIRAIEEDKATQTLWFGTQIGLYSYFNERFRYIPLSDEEALTVYCLKKVKQKLWIGTNNGLFLKEGKKIQKIELEDNFNANTINFLQANGENSIWVGTNNGIYVLKLIDEEYKIYHYTTNDGLKSLEGNLNASFKDKNGHLWFGTGGGLLRFSPELGESLEKVTEPKVHITGIRLFLEPMDYEKYSDFIIPESGLPNQLELPYNKNHITFDFIGISLKNSTSIRYRYKLQGFDSEWSPATSSPLATYSNLPFGTYTFSIMATNKSGIWSAPQSFTIIIRPPFWRTWWFYAICLLSVLILIYVIFYIRSRLVSRKRANQQLVYKSKLAALEQQSLNASMNRHFIFNALNSIQYFINISDKLSANRYLTKFAKLIRQNLDSTTTENYIVPLEEEIDRIKLYLSLESMRFEDKFEYEILVDQELDAEHVKVPSMMLQPYVENGIIHGILPKDEIGKILINIYKKGLQIIFEIEDDGIGINNSIEIKKKNTGETHISKGMEITSNRITLLQKITQKDISIEGPFQKKNGKKYPGTKVIIKLPLN